MTSENTSLFETKIVSDIDSLTDSATNVPENIVPEVQLDTALITFRVLVSSKEAGIIIGKNGSCVASVREKTGVKSGVSKVIIGTFERILTVSGPVDSTAEALSLFSQALLESPVSPSQSHSSFPLRSLCPAPQSDQTSLRLLIPHLQMGTLIGKQGSRIKALQENYEVKIVALKDFVGDSTERVVEVQGSPDKIEKALQFIARCLIEDWHGSTGTVYYVPQPRRKTDGYEKKPTAEDRGLASQAVNFDREYVGCLIGKKGVKIQEIRKVSGAQISIALEDDEQGQRSFKISGSQSEVEKALALLYEQVGKEKQRRFDSVHEE